MIRSVPIARILIPFIIGILIQIWLEPPFVFSAGVFILSALIYSSFIFVHAFNTYSSQFVSGVFIFFSIVAFGMLLTSFNTVKNSSTYFKNYDSISLYLATVDEDPIPKENSYKSVLKIKSVKSNGTWKDAAGKVLVYFNKENGSDIVFGQEIIFNRQPVEVDEPSNPNQFNYKRYLSFHNTYHQIFLAEKDFEIINKEPSFSLIGFSIQLRNKLLEILQKYIKNPRENAVASALVLGYNDAIDQDLVNAYSSAGAMHVLCVSGLHVGIIYIVLSRLLNFLNKKRILKIVKYLVLLGFIWFYAFITGLSPSVLRASTMISLIIMGNWIKGESNNVYNTLLASIFLLLFINPYLITEVGFQLSYLAVFSIVYVHPKLFALFKSQSYIWNRVWEITSVSISAQLATFPLAALYFHKFPNLFFVSNLVVIPAATLILYGCIILMLVAWLPVLVNIVAKFVAWVIWILNEVVLLIERIPYSIVDGISWSVIETWLVYFVIIGVVLFLVRKTPAFIQLSLVSLCLIFAYSGYNALLNTNQNKIVVYNINNTTAIDFISGDSNYLLANNSLLEDENAIRFHILQHWFSMRATNNHMLGIDELESLSNSIVTSTGNNYLLFNNNKIGIITEELLSQGFYKKPLQLDLAVINNMDYLNVEKLLNTYNCDRIVLDSSWPKWKANKIKDKLSEFGIKAHAVSTDKAFEWEI